MNARIADIARRALAGERLGRVDLFTLAEASRGDRGELLYWAQRVRTDRFGRAVALCSIVAGKLGGCGEDCKFCAQSARHAGANLQPRRTPRSEILAAATDAADRGAASLGIVNSGRRPSEQEIDEVVAATKSIGSDNRLGVCASLGELTAAQAERLAAAGVRRYNHNLETSRRLFGQVISTHRYEDRLRTLAAVRDAGMGICCGGIFGLGETWEDRIDLALTLRDEVGPTVVPLNFLHPIPGTPLADATPLTPMEILAIIAVFRLAMPDVDLKIAGGRERNLRDLQSWIFRAGATSILIGNYLTTTGRDPKQDLQMLADLGLEIVRELPGRCARS